MRPPTSLLELWEETGVHFGRKKLINGNKPMKQKKLTPSSTTNDFLLKSPSGLTLDLPPQRPKSSADESALLRSQKARSNWKRLAKKASERRRRDLANGNGDGKGGFSPNHVWYALEWEYLATVLDRLLLIVFSLVVFLVTSLMILIGEAMHLSYELSSEAQSKLKP
ncbi:unnamed protein product [Nippostrongylus brasiliensis]|uniref:Voltage-gated hydrogen channel 1 n=1 Tax=Nippostrongylus brasiliensis TaxID=27835 RepID=A0A0N4YDI6_NIPBR|nr:unnamed protein product [Nippostrongylus brasiliensis]